MKKFLIGLVIAVLVLGALGTAVWAGYAFVSPTYNPLRDALARTPFGARIVEAKDEVELPAEGLTAEQVQEMLNKAIAGIEVPEASEGLTAEQVQEMLNKAIAGIEVPEASEGLTAEQVQEMLNSAVADSNPEVTVADNPGTELSEIPALNAFDAGTYTMVPMGGLVDLTNPYAMPEGFPADWEDMTPRAQADWVEGVIGGPVEVVLGEPDVAFAFNGKGVITHSYTCPAGFTCHGHLVDGDRTVFFRGHGEVADYYAITVRVEGLIPGGGGLCQNWHDVLVFEASNTNIVHGLGEVSNCPPLPQDRLDDINTEMAKRLAEVKELSGADVITIGTVEDGFGAFWVYSNGLGVQDLTCPEGFRCLFTADGETWTWAEGPSEITGAQGAILFDVAVVADPEKVAAGLIE